MSARFLIGPIQRNELCNLLCPLRRSHFAANTLPDIGPSLRAPMVIQVHHAAVALEVDGKNSTLLKITCHQWFSLWFLHLYDYSAMANVVLALFKPEIALSISLLIE